MNDMQELDIITQAVKPIVVEVISESLTEAFLALEEKRRKRYYDTRP